MKAHVALAVAALSCAPVAAHAGCSTFGDLPKYAACSTFLANDAPVLKHGYPNGTPYRSTEPLFTRDDDQASTYGPGSGDEPWFRPYREVRTERATYYRIH